MHEKRLTRREILRGAGALAGMAAFGGIDLAPVLAAAKRPTAPVSIGRCTGYELPALTERLNTMFDQLGGIRKLVAGKTVVVKVNLTGSPTDKVGGLPANRTYQVHPNMALAAEQKYGWRV